MVAKCSGCGKYVSAADAAGCCTCKRINHRACVNLTRDAPVSVSWQCPDCKACLPRGNTESTPVRGSQGQGQEREDHRRQDGGSAISAADSELTKELYRFRDEMRETREEFRAARLEMQALHDKLGACEERLTRLEGKVSALEIQDIARVAGGADGSIVRTLEATVLQLQLDLNIRDQELLRNDVEVSGIPEESGENVTHLVLAVADKLGVALDERELVSCVRVGGVRTATALSGDAQVVRPRPIVVRLARRASRDTLLHAARVRRHLNTEGIGLRSDPKPFHLNERLTRTNRVLFNRARNARREHGWRYVWTRDGQVLARRDQGAPVHRIKVEADVDRVFGCAQIGRDDNFNK